MSTPHALAVDVSTYRGLTVYCSGNVFAAITVLFTVFGLLSFMVIYLQWRIQRGVSRHPPFCLGALFRKEHVLKTCR